MSSGSSVEAALKGAHAALDRANKFQKSVTGGNEDMSAKSKPAAQKSDYSHVRAARKAPGEFMGARSDEAPEINTALQAREDAKKALNQ